MKRPRNDFLLVGLSLFIVTGFLGWWLLSRRDACPRKDVETSQTGQGRCL